MWPRVQLDEEKREKHHEEGLYTVDLSPTHVVTQILHTWIHDCSAVE